MNENILNSILAEICDEETAILDKLPSFKLSLRHRIAMERLFGRYEKNLRRGIPKFHCGRLSLRTRVLIIVAAIICAALMLGFTSVYFSKCFHGTVYADNTRISAANTEKCPATIEYTYCLSDLPEGFEMVEQDSTYFQNYTEYRNLSGQTIVILQSTKKDFGGHFNTEHNTFEEIEVNGKYGFYLPNCNGGVIVWDNGDYILEITGNFNKDELLNLAKSAKVLRA